MIGIFVAVLAQECCLPDNCWAYCRVNHAGAKNYFNSTSCSCEAPAKCPEGQVFDFESNSCLSRLDIPQLEFPTANNYTTVGETSSDCVNGELRGSICACFEGYTTSKYQEGSLKECDTRTVSGSNSIIGKPKEETFTFIEKVGILFGLSVVLCCVSCCIKKRLKRSKPDI